MRGRRRGLRKITPAKIVFILACLCVFLPWFTWNAKMTGYCWGFYFVLELAAPMVVIGVYLGSGSRGKWFAALTELSSLLVIAIAVTAMGRWQIRCNITGVWEFAPETAQPTYWFSLVAFAALFAAIQFEVFKRAKNRPRLHNAVNVIWFT